MSTTTTRSPDRTELRAMRALTTLLDGATDGALRITLPDGRWRLFGSPNEHPTVRVEVTDWAFFRRVLTGASVGLGEAWMDHDFETDDLVGFVRWLVRNRPALRGAVTAGTVASIATDLALHWSNRNRIGQSQRNIEAHYDLSNDLYETFLDPTMTYSSAYFPTPEATLEEAQLAKYRRLAESVRLQPGDHVLEIGCGWGGFASVAAREYGARVTGVTLSTEQAEYARERMQREGIDHLVDIQIIDYREVEGVYDKVVSIEMLEAVGHRYFGEYFSQVDRLLSPDGLAAIQVITLPDQRYSNYRARPDFIQRYIFPGGHLPSLTAMSEAMTEHSALMVETLENMSTHYAETLRRWRHAFLGNRVKVEELGFDDRFCRMWEFYFAYCEGGFAERYINVVQVLLTRTANGTLGVEPYGVSQEPTHHARHLNAAAELQELIA